MKRIVVALFSRRDEAERALAALRQQGLDRDGARLIGGGPEAVGPLVEFGMSGAERRYFSRGIAEGAAVLAVPAGNPAAVVQTLRDFQPDEVLDEEFEPALDPAEEVKSASGPTHSAPENSHFSTSFDEFAGAFGVNGFELLGHRDSEDYALARDAYTFGQDIARGDRFMARDWSQAAPEIEREWDQGRRGPWHRAAPLVQKGWEHIRGMG